MGLIDLFNQWVVERGSAVVQEKHIALFRDQLIAADKKALVLESENSILKTENEQLKSGLDQLRNKIQTHDQPTHDVLLEDVQVKILSFLWKQPNKTPEKICISLKIDLEAIKYHLAELEKMEMVQTDTFGDWPTTYRVWLLAQEGRRYVIEHK